MSVDLEMAGAFVAALTGDAETPCTWQTFDDNAKRKDKALAVVRHGTLAEHAAELERLNDDGAGIFITVNETDLQGRRTENIKALRALFVDCDTGDLPPLPMPPSIVVQSGHGQHAYWLLHPGEPLDAFRAAQEHLAAALGTDPSVKDLPRVMRVPGFDHHKGQPFRVTILEADLRRVYSIGAVTALLPDAPSQVPKPLWRPSQAWPAASKVARARAYLARVNGAVQGHRGDAATFRAACLACNDFDLSDAEALEVLREWNATCAPPWSDTELEQKIKNARRYSTKAPGSKLNERRRDEPPPPCDSDAPPDAEPAAPPLELDIKAWGLARHAAELSATETDETALSRRLLDDLETALGHPPVVTRGSIYGYQRATGTWREIDRETLLAIVHCYSGCAVETVDAKTGEVKTAHLKLSANKAAGVATAALRSLKHREPTYFDDAPGGVAFANGFATVSAEGVSFAERSPDHRQIACVPYDYDADARCPGWIETLRKVFGVGADGQEKTHLLQEFVGACLAGVATNYAACLVLIGDGANGKSVVAETIAEQLFPPGSVTYSTPQGWTGRFATARLLNSRLNVASELPDAEIQASDVFKSVIDGGYIQVERKNRDPFDMRPRAGHIFLTNSPPQTRDNSHGFWRRLLMVRFDHDFSKDPDRQTKEAVKARLAPEAAGIMLWALHGAVRLLRHGGYTKPASHDETIEDARLATDSVAAFVAECCERETDTWSASSAVYEAFCRWASKVGRMAVSQATLSLRLKSLKIGFKKTKHCNVFNVEVLPQSEWAEGKLPQLRLVTEQTIHHPPEVTA